jgi:FkbM family methyltransferase
VISGPESDLLYQLYQEIWCRGVYTQGGFGVSPNSVVMDIGANIGAFALFAAWVPGVRVFAFEPHPRNYEFLQSNITANKANVRPFPLAVANERGLRKVWLDGTSGGHRLYDRVLNGRLERWIEVQTETLAGAISSCGLTRVDFLKLDCEGAEFEILLNCSASCLKQIGKISLEFHNHVTPHTHHEIARFLEEHGFIVRVPEVRGTFGILQARSCLSGMGADRR